jgi:hypothetical protein
LTYIHRSEVHLVKNVHASLTSTEKGASVSAKAAYAGVAIVGLSYAYCCLGWLRAEKDPIAQAKFCHLQMGDVLVIVTLTGLVHVSAECF